MRFGLVMGCAKNFNRYYPFLLLISSLTTKKVTQDLLVVPLDVRLLSLSFGSSRFGSWTMLSVPDRRGSRWLCVEYGVLMSVLAVSLLAMDQADV
jgi:hypothetical protein